MLLNLEVLFDLCFDLECLGPQDIPYVYCLFYVTFVPLRWLYYKYKKWHYYLLVSNFVSLSTFEVIRISIWSII